MEEQKKTAEESLKEELTELAAEIDKEISEELKAEPEAEATETIELESEPEAEATETIELESEPEAEVTESIELEAEAEAQSETEEAPKKKSKKALWIVLGILGGILLLLAIGYYAVARHYEDRFLMKTSVNGTDCTGMTVEEVEAIMQDQVENYVLTIVGRNAVTQEIAGVDIGIKYNGVNVIQEAFEEQNSYLWFQGLYKETDIKAEVDFDYDAEKLDAVIANLEVLKPENQVAPVSATPVYQEGSYVIQAENYGAQLDGDKVRNVIHECVANIVTDVNLEEKECYINPVFTKDSPEVIAAKDALNKCLETNVTYSLDGIVVNVNADMVKAWISVDANMAVLVDEAQVRAFTNSLGTHYNTPDGTQEITTPRGRVTAVPNGRKGRIVGSAAECTQLIAEIREGKQVTREPIIAQQPTPEGALSWGTTYVEVDLIEQHMWYIVNGAVAFECDVVTGSPGRDTPAGCFTILEKLSPKVLRGNIMPNGKPEYVTPVKYWARVTWSGIGFHDATWQAAFGGNRYREGYGSHGCINMAYNDVATFYNMIAVGCPVVIHH
ncbi:MAG: L,D-transpeptidase family protein [Faecalimonas sp.]|nr:L,D-transpeptidase family protein [Faecalimonas sp.]